MRRLKYNLLKKITGLNRKKTCVLISLLILTVSVLLFVLEVFEIRVSRYYIVFNIVRIFFRSYSGNLIISERVFQRIKPKWLKQTIHYNIIFSIAIFIIAYSIIVAFGNGYMASIVQGEYWLTNHGTKMIELNEKEYYYWKLVEALLFWGINFGTSNLVLGYDLGV